MVGAWNVDERQSRSFVDIRLYIMVLEQVKPDQILQGTHALPLGSELEMVGDIKGCSRKKWRSGRRVTIRLVSNVWTRLRS